MGAAAGTALAQHEGGILGSSKRAGSAPVKITDLKCAIIGKNPVVRIVTDQGISGYGQAESAKPYLKPMVEFYKPYLIGTDPTDVGRQMLRLRRLGAFKPWGAALSAIEIALWDVAGQAADLPVHKLLGGKIRDKVLAYGNSENNTPIFSPPSPQVCGELAAKMKEAKEGYKLVKMPVAFHNGPMMKATPNEWFGQQWTGRNSLYMERGQLTQHGFDYIMQCVEAMKKNLGDDIDLALDCGPGWTPKDAIRFARAVEPYHLAWLEDLITGDGEPYTNAQAFKLVTESTSTPIHTGEEVYLREGFKDLIEMQAIDVVGPDPEDVGGIAELKWIAEYADLHHIQVAPHGIFDGLFGVAAQVHLGAVCPQNYIGFEYAKGQPEWWYEIVEGLPDPIVKDGYIDVWDKPGLGVSFNIKAAKARLTDDDRTFFD
ncbi:mandelate racemase/muconate lactonizing enzyme family protein [Silvibacterium acidisoli]|uniref:mandelate racemase/muconate lactonizing enzyme family protein n=1 Tax=Acidobacteriaceae bacterium ZG23-2 TaxID=2883246 RepID=UPI00406BF886